MRRGPLVALALGVACATAAALGMSTMLADDSDATYSAEASAPSRALAEDPALRRSEAAKALPSDARVSPASETPDAEVEGAYAAAPAPATSASVQAPPQADSTEATPASKSHASQSSAARRATRRAAATQRRELDRRISDACGDYVHRDTRVVVRVKESGESAVRIDPNYPLLRRCIETHASDLPAGQYATSLHPPAR